MNSWSCTTDELIEAFKANDITRGYVVTDASSKQLRCSHPVLQPIVDALGQDKRDYQQHQGLFLEIGAQSDHLCGAFIHKTKRGQAAGGVRYWSYDKMEDYLRDGLRLARGMGHKCALAGLWWGGGKGVVARRGGQDYRDPQVRQAVYQDYGRFMSGLRGCYVTAEDAGTTPPDMAVVFSTTRHTTCIPQDCGGSGNPSILTAQGVVVAMEAALAHLGKGTLEGKTVAMQGVGNVSLYMIGDLLQRKVAKIIGHDIDEKAIAAVRERFADAPLELKLIGPDDQSIMATPCDILAPNAVGATLNAKTIPEIKAAIVCGAANNQLEDPLSDDKLLKEHNVLYVPDFLANRMGIVNCANEQYGIIDDDPAITCHLDHASESGVYRRSMDIFERAQKSGRTTAFEAVALAEELGDQPHPIWGNRGQLIIDFLVRSGWAQ